MVSRSWRLTKKTWYFCFLLLVGRLNCVSVGSYLFAPTVLFAAGLFIPLFFWRIICIAGPPERCDDRVGLDGDGRHHREGLREGKCSTAEDQAVVY